VARERSDHDGLDRVKTVLGLIKDDRSRRLKDLVGDFECLHPELRKQLSTDLGVGVMQSRQAVKESRIGVVS